MKGFNSRSYNTLLDESYLRSNDESCTMKKTGSSSRQCLLVACISATILAISLGVGLGVTLLKASTKTSTDSGFINVPASETRAPTTVQNSLSSYLPSSVPFVSDSPTLIQSESSSSIPSEVPTNTPSGNSTNEPSSATNITSPPPISTSKTTESPQRLITEQPNRLTTEHPTPSPTTRRTDAPSVDRSDTSSPTPDTTTSRADPPIIEGTRTTFYAIGDVPYTERQAVELVEQMEDLPKDAEFVIHVGDVRNGEADEPCLEADFANAASILRRSHAPVFIILGDNDWNDCINRDEAWGFWKKHLLKLDSRHWSHSFNVIRHPKRSENFAFTHKGSLFVGLNLVGGAVHSESEWQTRLTDQVAWTMELIRKYRDEVAPNIGRVVLFGQADPRSSHNEFFVPLESFIRDELQNRLPILYINGDKHFWQYEPNFFGQSSFLRIMVTGQTKDPPLKVIVNANGEKSSTKDAFLYDRSP